MDPEQYVTYYQTQAGNGLPGYAGGGVMYGAGFGGMLRKLFRMTIPLLRQGFSIAKPHLKSAAKNILSDVVTNTLTRLFNNNNAQEGSGLMVMSCKRSLDLRGPGGVVKITNPNSTDIADGAPVGLFNYAGATIFSQVDVSLGDRLISQNGGLQATFSCAFQSISCVSAAIMNSKFSYTIKDILWFLGLTDLSIHKQHKNTGIFEFLLVIPMEKYHFLPSSCISHHSNDVMCKQPIECLLNYDKHTLETVFSAGLFYKDRAGHMDAADPAGGNHGLTKRAAFTNASNVVELLAPIHSDIFFQEKLMLNGVDIKIRMTRGKDEFCHIKKNPFAFKNYDLEFLSIYVDGQQFPAKPLQPNYGTGSAVREFYQLALASGKHLKNQALSIDREDFTR
ncbi:hypothetical protein H4Q32_028939 [Labeo rohita]|uniref:Uncharacterized protein n=1 Tax=Labeo rohita TaxID=84645 RepID=A0ABQ8L3Y7_LABRO|nr:hypothetical protein H4Q32_028939 [Labeo rohita]